MVMTVKAMSAGDGFRYLANTIAFGGGDAGNRKTLSAYYNAPGNPPGRWGGSGLTLLGDGIAHGDTITLEQMDMAFGHGLNPTTGEVLGLRFAEYPTYRERVAERMAKIEPGLTPEDHKKQVALIRKEEKRRGTKKSVAAWDLTFSPQKSLSILWGLGDEGVKEIFYEAHQQAVAETLKLAESEVARTRVGRGGAATVEVQGLIWGSFDHYDSRSNDPDIHTHVVVMNKVQGLDGKWRTLDGKQIYRAAVALSSHYNAILTDIVTERTGLDWQAMENHYQDGKKGTVWEIKGVERDMKDAFSKRRQQILEHSNQAIANHAGDATTNQKLDKVRDATIRTRPAKKLFSLAELTTKWRTEAAARFGIDPIGWVSGLLAKAEQEPAKTFRFDDVVTRIPDIAQQVIGVCESKRATWTRWNLHNETAILSQEIRFTDYRDRERFINEVVDQAVAFSTQLTVTREVLGQHRFARADGTNAFDPVAGSMLFSSDAILNAEAAIMQRAETVTELVLPDDVLADSVAWSKEENGRELDVGQLAAITQIASSGLAVDVLVGPAGSGKTDTLATLTHAWKSAFGSQSVLGLAPSAAAAEVLADSLTFDTDNTAKFLTELARLDDMNAMYKQANEALASGTLSEKNRANMREVIDGVNDWRRKWMPRKNQLIIIDESSMVGTLAMETVTAAANAAGAKVLLVGDWAQLSAVDAGGAFGMIVRSRTDAPTLTEVHRFNGKDNQWERAASLKLRSGDANIINLYEKKDRVHELEHPADAIDAAMTAWAADRAEGKTSILVAGDNTTVAALNAAARKATLADREETGVEMLLSDGNHASAGDIVLTRKNDRKLRLGRTAWVRNGDTWLVHRVNEDGSLLVAREGKESMITLPARYVDEHVELGYATTAHRAQGITVDTCHSVVTSESYNRATLYVALTRGRKGNHAWVATENMVAGHNHGDITHTTSKAPDEVPEAADVLRSILANDTTVLSATEIQTLESEAVQAWYKIAPELETVHTAAIEERWQPMLEEHFTDFTIETFDTAEWRKLSRVLIAIDNHCVDAEATNRLIADFAGEHELAVDETSIQHLQQLLAEVRTNQEVVLEPMQVLSQITINPGHIDDTYEEELHTRVQLLEGRAQHLVAEQLERYADGKPNWIHILMRGTLKAEDKQTWLEGAQVVAAYRDRYGIDDDDNALGGTGGREWARRTHWTMAAAAVKTCRELTQPTTTSDVDSTRHAPDAGIGL